MTPSARLAAAIELLDAIERTPRRPADAIAHDFFRARRFIGSGDRRAVSERVWTVLRRHRRLSWHLGAAATPRLLVAASLLFEGWTLSGLLQTYAGGRFGPAPLTAAERSALGPLEAAPLEVPAMPDPVRRELPDWLHAPLLARFGDALDAELAALSEPAPLDLRVNTLRTTREEARARLAEEGIEAEPTRLSPWGLRVAGRRPVTTCATFQQGLVEVQDEGSQLVALLCAAAPGMRVADYCAGAGGKTLALAATMANRGHLVACDVSASRLEGALRRLRRAGVHNAERHLLEAGDRWARRRAGSFDRVLVDAPCTGSGTWRRNPDARRHLAERDLAELTARQAAILDQAAPLVRAGGWLVYATCSLLQEENESQVDAFLRRHPGFATRPLPEIWPLPGRPGPGPFLSLTPHAHGTDGFFAAVLERQPK